MKLERMLPFLSRHPDREVAVLLEARFREGFTTPSTVQEVPPVSGNLRSALAHEGVVSAKLNKEVSLGRIGWPVSGSAVERFDSFPVGCGS